MTWSGIDRRESGRSTRSIVAHVERQVESSMNPYAASGEASEPLNEPVLCARRTDVVLIAVILSVAVAASFVSLAIPSARNFMMPRFGWGGLNLLLFPLNFLGLYLWKPAPRLLAMAGFMCLFVSTANALSILRSGTVMAVSNPFQDRLPSSYLWSVVPILAIGLYLCWIAWQTRSHVARPSS